jgi:hypothetical protein
VSGVIRCRSSCRHRPADDQFGADKIIITASSDQRYVLGSDTASAEYQLRRHTALATIWPQWLRSPMREQLVRDIIERGQTGSAFSIAT